MFPARFMSLVVVALSTLTVHGLAPAAAPAAVTKSNNGTSGATVGTNDTAGRSGIIQACISDNYEGCLNVEFVENMCTYLPYPKTMSSVKVPKNWICTFDDEHCSGNFWTVVFDDLPAMWHVSFNDAAASFRCAHIEWHVPPVAHRPPLAFRVCFARRLPHAAFHPPHVARCTCAHIEQDLHSLPARASSKARPPVAALDAFTGYIRTEDERIKNEYAPTPRGTPAIHRYPRAPLPVPVHTHTPTHAPASSNTSRR
ncbi:hypothetical protein GGX14DRAFT_581194 [Mycena pura]|uniref:Uncharacterized protein n=1 Tax=Mycena pura TaxID=153505 RepID=A0AAD6XX05_9AGAR|nr:hypothetical protein GGX14DRAFT_581194 [Mycena pura]